MRTISYILVKDEAGNFFGTNACRGALCYTGRVLLADFKEPDRILRLINEGPIDMVGTFADESEGIHNPAIVTKATEEQAARLLPVFRNGPATISLEALSNQLKEHNHFGAVNIFVFENNKWMYSKHNLKNFVQLTNHIVEFDDEEIG